MKPRLTTASSLSVLGVLSPGNLMIGDGAAKVLFRRYTWMNSTLKTKPQPLWVFILPKLVLSSLEKAFPHCLSLTLAAKCTSCLSAHLNSQHRFPFCLLQQFLCMFKTSRCAVSGYHKRKSENQWKHEKRAVTRCDCCDFKVATGRQLLLLKEATFSPHLHI